MTPKALEALKASCKHWRENVEAADYFDTGTDVGDCALCKAYWHSNAKISCEGCPVYAHTGQRRCEGTPFYAAEITNDVWGNTAAAGIIASDARAAWRKAAQAELDFLISLLPEGEAP